MLARNDRINWKNWCLGHNNYKHVMWDTLINDDLIKKLNTTFGEMSRYVLFGTKQLKGEVAKNTTKTY